MLIILIIVIILKLLIVYIIYHFTLLLSEAGGAAVHLPAARPPSCGASTFLHLLSSLFGEVNIDNINITININIIFVNDDKANYDIFVLQFTIISVLGVLIKILLGGNWGVVY